MKLLISLFPFLLAASSPSKLVQTYDLNCGTKDTLKIIYVRDAGMTTCFHYLMFSDREGFFETKFSCLPKNSFCTIESSNLLLEENKIL